MQKLLLTLASMFMDKLILKIPVWTKGLIKYFKKKKNQKEFISDVENEDDPRVRAQRITDKLNK